MSFLTTDRKFYIELYYFQESNLINTRNLLPSTRDIAINFQALCKERVEKFSTAAHQFARTSR
jgi:hypothetical protein